MQLLDRGSRRRTNNMIMIVFTVGVAGNITALLLDVLTRDGLPLGAGLMATVRTGISIAISVALIAHATADGRQSVDSAGRRTDAHVDELAGLVRQQHQAIDAMAGHVAGLATTIASLAAEQRATNVRVDDLADQLRHQHDAQALVTSKRFEALTARIDDVSDRINRQHPILADVRDLAGEQIGDLAAIARRGLGGVLAMNKRIDATNNRLDDLEVPNDEKALNDAHWRGYAACIEDQQHGRVVPLSRR